MIPIAQISNQPQQGAMSLEQQFVNLYTVALLNLQSTWLNNDGKVDGMAHGLQIEFIINLIPDQTIQDRIRKKQVELTETYKRKGDSYASIRAGMYAVSEAVKFLVSTFELINYNGIGPATNNEIIYLDGVASASP